VGALDYGTSDAPRYWDRLTFYRRHFRPAVARVGLPHDSYTGVRFHDLRHTAGSQWVEDGHEMFYVSRWLGHASLAFTDRVYAKMAERPDWSSHVEKTRAAKARTTNVVTFPSAASN
jgi:integrase